MSSPEEITSDHIAQLMLEVALHKGIMEFQAAKDAVIAIAPATKDIPHTTWANEWKSAKTRLRKELGTPHKPDGDQVEGDEESMETIRKPDGTPIITDGKVDQIPPTPMEPVIIRKETVAPPGGGGPQINIIVPGAGGSHLLTDGKVKFGDGKSRKPNGKPVYVFIKPLIKNGNTFKMLQKATETWAGAMERGILDNVVDLILRMQKDFMPGINIKKKIKTDFQTDFALLVDGISTYIDDKGGMSKGWEDMKLNTKSGNQPPQEPSQTPQTPTSPTENSVTPQPTGAVSAPSPTL